MNTGQCIVNMLNCRQGEHCLFRSFGLGAVTDQVGRLRRAQITQEVAKWYPAVTSVQVEVRTANITSAFRRANDGFYQ